MNTLCTYYKIKLVVLAKVRLSYIRELAETLRPTVRLRPDSKN